MRNTVKILVALVVIIAAMVWAITSTQTLSDSGSDLNMAIGQGVVTVVNRQDAPVPVQLVGSGTRSFAVSSSVDGISGSSSTQGTGSDRIQLLEFMIPEGETQFTLTRGSDVNLVTPSDAPLNVTLQPLSPSATQTTIVIAIAAILIALYYISHTTGHRWIGMLRGKAAPQPITESSVTAASGQGAEIRAYGDNRADVSKHSTPL